MVDRVCPTILRHSGWVFVPENTPCKVCVHFHTVVCVGALAKDMTKIVSATSVVCGLFSPNVPAKCQCMWPDVHDWLGVCIGDCAARREIERGGLCTSKS